jgi:hypothetical protein
MKEKEKDENKKHSDKSEENTEKSDSYGFQVGT